MKSKDDNEVYKRIIFMEKKYMKWRLICVSEREGWLREEE